MIDRELQLLRTASRAAFGVALFAFSLSALGFLLTLNGVAGAINMALGCLLASLPFFGMSVVLYADVHTSAGNDEPSTDDQNEGM